MKTQISGKFQKNASARAKKSPLARVSSTNNNFPYPSFIPALAHMLLIQFNTRARTHKQEYEKLRQNKAK